MSVLGAQTCLNLKFILIKCKVTGTPRNGENQRIFLLEGTIESHLVQAPCHGQRHLSLDQVGQRPIQPVHEYFQGWGICHL